MPSAGVFNLNLREARLSILKYSGGRLEHGKTCLWIAPVPGLHQSLDGYVDHMKLGPPAPAAFRHFIELALHRTGAWRDGPDLRTPHVRDHALLGAPHLSRMSSKR